MKINKNILSLKDEFDIFFFDAYGVLWNGSDFYEGSKEALGQLVSEGKTVVIVSNATISNANSEKKYETKGLVKGKHYNFIITSGEMLNNYFINNRIPEINALKNGKNLKIYIYSNGETGAIRKENGEFISGIEETKNPAEADFIYITVPRMNNEEYLKYIEKYPENKKYLTAYSKNENGEVVKWETSDIKVFRGEIRELAKVILEKNILVINPNADLFANSKDVENNVGVVAARQGSVVKELQKNGVSNIVEFGKPNKNIYEFTFEYLKNNGLDISGKKIVMVGDTLGTDIKGANNIGISSVLCCKTGLTSDLVCGGCTLENLIRDEEVEVDHFIESVGCEN